ncbi:MAG: methionyl-tRNA formyltransferase [Deltaproteobacteria bacterium]
MKIVFFGSGAFAVPILEALHAGRHDVAAVVTQPDRRKGRHLHLAPTPVKETAHAHGIAILQPVDIHAPALADALRRFNADAFVVVSYGHILPDTLLGIPSRMCVNIHASLLPAYRGAAPIQRALMAGERVTGVTFIRMDKRMDRGDILLRKRIRIGPADDAFSLEAKLARCACGSIHRVLALLERGKLRPVRQDERKASYAPKLKKEDGRIDWSQTSRMVMARFRGCAGWPGSFTTWQGRRLIITAMAPGRRFRTGAPGEILARSPRGLEIACGRGSVLVRELVPESHPKTSASSFAAAHGAACGARLGTATENT